MVSEIPSCLKICVPLFHHINRDRYRYKSRYSWERERKTIGVTLFILVYQLDTYFYKHILKNPSKVLTDEYFPRTTLCYL